LVLRQKAVAGCIELYKAKTENCVSSINAGVIPPLLTLLKDNDSVVRERSLDALTYLANMKKGRDILIENGSIHSLKESADDESNVAQVNALRTMANLGKEPHGCELLFKECVPLFIRKAAQGDNEAKAAALSGLKRALTIKGCDELAIQHHVVPVITQILNDNVCRESDKLISIAADCTASISFNPPGMYECVQYKTVYPLLDFIQSPDPQVRQQTMNALMQITVAKEGKMQCLENEVKLLPLKVIVKREEEPKPNKIHALKLITNIAEHPSGRELFIDLLPRLRYLQEKTQLELAHAQESDDPILSSDLRFNPLLFDTVRIAADMIAWEP
jgi:hypothetical protein